MCLAGGTGVTMKLPADAGAAHGFLYGEDQGRYLAATDDGNALLAAAATAGVPATLLGYAGGQALVVEGLLALPLAELRAVHEAWLPTYMNSAA
jgi:phosphoribosylformylglycinamidine synthase subunit PurL